MGSQFSDEQNPYQPPPSGSSASSPHYPPAGVDVAQIKKFRDQIHALGAYWIIIGGLAIGLSAMALGSNKELLLKIDSEQMAIWTAIICLGVVWIVLGLLTCLKQMWAVYVALVLSYLSLIANLVQLAVIAIIFLVAVIAQAHRVIIWARQLNRAQVPLSARPKDYSPQ